MKMHWVTKHTWDRSREAHLVRVLAAAVERVWDGKLGVEAPAQHQLEQGHLVSAQGLGRAGSCLQLLQVVPQLKLHILAGRQGRWVPGGSPLPRGYY